MLFFVMAAVVVIDLNSKFPHIYKYMCAALGMKFWPFSRGNHKGMSVEHYHWFLNKTQTFFGDRGTHYSILENSKTSQYT